MESKSRRHVMVVGKIEGNESKMKATPNTRNIRRINDVSDINGAVPKVKGTGPSNYNSYNSVSPQKTMVKNASDIFNLKNDPYEMAK